MTLKTKAEYEEIRRRNRALVDVTMDRIMDVLHKPVDFTDALRQREEISRNMAKGQEDAKRSKVPEVRGEQVNHPSHYGGEDNPYECIKVVEAWGLGFNLGNCVKYVSRCEAKGSRITDLKKAAWYLAREIANLEKGEDSKPAHGFAGSLEQAWGIIANAWEGDWSKASPEWRQAAEWFRDAYHGPEKLAFVARRGDSPVEKTPGEVVLNPAPLRQQEVEVGPAAPETLCVQPGCYRPSAGTSWGNCKEHWGTLPPEGNAVPTARDNRIEGGTVQAKGFDSGASERVRDAVRQGASYSEMVAAVHALPPSATEWVKDCDGGTFVAQVNGEPACVSPSDFPIQHRKCATVWFRDDGPPLRVCACPCFCCSRNQKARGNPRIVEGRLETDTDRLVRDHAAVLPHPHPDMPVVSGPFHAPPPAP